MATIRDRTATVRRPENVQGRRQTWTQREKKITNLTKMRSYVPVTPNGDHPAIALRSRTLKFCTKAQWHCWKVWNPRHHVAYNSLQYALG